MSVSSSLLNQRPKRTRKPRFLFVPDAWSDDDENNDIDEDFLKKYSHNYNAKQQKVVSYKPLFEDDIDDIETDESDFNISEHSEHSESEEYDDELLDDEDDKLVMTKKNDKKRKESPTIKLDVSSNKKIKTQ